MDPLVPAWISGPFHTEIDASRVDVQVNERGAESNDVRRIVLCTDAISSSTGCGGGGEARVPAGLGRLWWFQGSESPDPSSIRPPPTPEMVALPVNPVYGSARGCCDA